MQIVLAFLVKLFLSAVIVLKGLFPLKIISLAGLPPFISPGRNFVQRVTVDLTSAQLLALLGTPVQVVPAPGLGLRIVPLLAMIHLIAGSAAYTDAGGAVSLSAGSASYPFTDNNIFLVTTSPNKRTMTMSFGEVLDTAANPPTTDNAPLNISKATNNLAAGNGTARVTVFYFIEPST